MSTSLKELRELSSNIEKKKKEIRETEKNKTVEEKNRLKRETAQQAMERAAQTEATTKKAKRLRQATIVAATAAMLFAVAVALRLMVLAWSGDNLGNTSLVSNNLELLDTGDTTYGEAAEFAENVVSSFKKNPEEYRIPFHPALSGERVEAFEQSLADAAGNADWSIAEIKHDGISDCLTTVFASGDKKLTLEIVKTENDFKVVKVY